MVETKVLPKGTKNHEGKKLVKSTNAFGNRARILTGSRHPQKNGPEKRGNENMKQKVQDCKDMETLHH